MVFSQRTRGRFKAYNESRVEIVSCFVIMLWHCSCICGHCTSKWNGASVYKTMLWKKTRTIRTRFVFIFLHLYIRSTEEWHVNYILSILFTRREFLVLKSQFNLIGALRVRAVSKAIVDKLCVCVLSATTCVCAAYLTTKKTILFSWWIL